MKKLAGLSIILAILAVIIGVIVFYPQPTEKPVQSAVNGVRTLEPLNANEIFELVNQERARAGVPALVRDSRLDGTAQIRADDMHTRQYLGHRDPVTQENLVNILKSQKQCVYASENISAYQNNQDDVIKSWLDSVAHREAMLDSKYTLSGIAISNRIIVQHFCQQ